MPDSDDKVRINVHILFMEHEEDVTLRAIDSVLGQLGPADRISVLLNGAHRPDLKDKMTSVHGINYYESDTNLGVAGGRNFLLQTQEGKTANYIVYVDNDAIIPADYLDEAVSFLDDHKDCGVMGAVVLKYHEIAKYHPRLWQNYTGFLGGEVWSVHNSDVAELLDSYHREALLDHIGSHKDWYAAYLDDEDTLDLLKTSLGLQNGREFISFNASNPDCRQAVIDPTIDFLEVSNIPGCCQAFRRSLVDEIGGLNDLFNPYGYEDADFCIRAIKAGYKNYTNLKTFMFHGTDERHANRHMTANFPNRKRTQNRAQAILDYLHAPESFPYMALKRAVQGSVKGPVHAAAIDLALCADGIREACNQLHEHDSEGLAKSIAACNTKYDLSLTVDKLLYFNPVPASDGETAEALMTAIEDQRRLTRLEQSLLADGEVYGERGYKYWRNRFNPNMHDKPNFKAMAKFKDRFKGERCFIIGNGPSLKKTDMALLRGEYTFGVNGLFYMTDQNGFRPSFYVVEDNHVVEDNLARINSYQAEAKFFPDKYAGVVEADVSTHFLPTDWYFYWESSPHYAKPRFSHELTETIYTGQTVTYLNLQLAHYMGFDEVYIVGLDFSYQIPRNDPVSGWSITSQGDDPNHFHPDYFGKGKKWHFPKLHNCLKSYKFSRNIYEKTGRTIRNATIGGMLEAYERVDYLDLFDNAVSLDTPNETVINYWHQACRYFAGSHTMAVSDSAAISHGGQLARVADHYGTTDGKVGLQTLTAQEFSGCASELCNKLRNGLLSALMIDVQHGSDNFLNALVVATTDIACDIFVHNNVVAIARHDQSAFFAEVFCTAAAAQHRVGPRQRSTVEEAIHTLNHRPRENSLHMISSPLGRSGLPVTYFEPLFSLLREFHIPYRLSGGTITFTY